MIIAVLAVAAGLPAAADRGAAAASLELARAALAKGDGVAAEARLRAALKAGATAEGVRALMGEAYLAQDDLAKARHWLAPARFAPGTGALGYRMLGRLELRERRLPEAGLAFDKALAEEPRNARLWTDIARLRYTGGEQAGAIAASQFAVSLAPGDPSTLWFRGLMIRQQIGYAAARPWFDSALTRAPDDPVILLDQAATLFELGRYAEGVERNRAARKVQPDNPIIIYQRAVTAARSGNRSLARRLLQRTQGKLRDTPGAMLVSAALELDAGNINLSVELADRLSRYQPDNPLAQALLARALMRSGDVDAVVGRLGKLAAGANASPYLLTTVARALEESGKRAEAVGLLARAASGSQAPLAPLPAGADLPVLAARYPDAPREARQAVPFMRAAVALGRTEAGAAAAERLFAANPGAPAAAEMAGDAAVLRGSIDRAIRAYRAAAQIELGTSEFLRLERALRMTGQSRNADLLVVAFATEHPQDLVAVRLLADLRARNRQWREAAALLEWLDVHGGSRDAAVLADLAFAQLRMGQGSAARTTAKRAAALQPARASVRQIVALTR